MRWSALRRWWLIPVAATGFMGLVIVALPPLVADQVYGFPQLRTATAAGFWSGPALEIPGAADVWVMILPDGKAYADPQLLDDRGAYVSPKTPSGYLAGLPLTWTLTKTDADSGLPGMSDLSFAYAGSYKLADYRTTAGTHGLDLYGCSYGGDLIELTYAPDPDSPCPGPEMGFYLDRTGSA